MLKFLWAIVYMQVNIETRARAAGGWERQIGSENCDRRGRQEDGKCGREPEEVMRTMQEASVNVGDNKAKQSEQRWH